MSWTEVVFEFSPRDPWADITTAELGELGYDMFQETAHGLKAYIRTEHFDAAGLDALLAVRDPHVHVNRMHHAVADRNWNAEWEASFNPVRVGDKVLIRAEHHAAEPAVEHDIVIAPRMAFGTGHHATTRMMVEAMLELPMEGRRVVDMGCGTAVLAILAEKLGAAEVLAVDIDQAAVDSARDAVLANRCTRITVERGDLGLLRSGSCGALLANIERNTLLRGMELMSAALEPGGTLLLSGFVNADAPKMQEAAERAGLRCTGVRTEGDWCLVSCERP